MSDFAIPPNPQEFINTGDEGIEEWPLKDASLENSQSMGTVVTSMGIVSKITGRNVRFINSADGNIIVFACAQADTQALYNIELAVKAAIPHIAEIGVERALQPVKTSFPDIFEQFLLQEGGEPEVANVPKGAEGYNFIWCGQRGGTWRFSGRKFASTNSNVKFTDLGFAMLD